MIRFACPACGKSLKAPHSSVGARCRCTRCHKLLLVPAPPPEEEPVPGIPLRGRSGPAEADYTEPPPIRRSPGPVSDPEDPMTLRTVWRTGHEPKLVHWLLGGVAAAGQHVAFEDIDWTACSVMSLASPFASRTSGSGETLDKQTITCPKCLSLLRALDAGNNCQQLS